MKPSLNQFLDSLAEVKKAGNTHYSRLSVLSDAANLINWHDLQLDEAFKAIGLSDKQVKSLCENSDYSKTEILQSLINELLRTTLEDGLTGVYNRRFFERSLNAELDRSRREQRPCGLLLLDIDFFKQFNDRYGHDAGDLVLKTVASTISSALRITDTVSRVGGEEFAVIVPNTFHLDAKFLAERIRKAVESLEVCYKDEKLKVSVSIGVAINDPKVRISLDQFYKQADNALYRAKQEGRNCVRFDFTETQKPSSAVSADERNELLG